MPVKKSTSFSDEPAKVEEPVVKAEEEEKKEKEDPEEKERKEIMEKVGKILKEHGNMESNIGVNNEYWDLMSRYRKLTQN